MQSHIDAIDAHFVRQSILLDPAWLEGIKKNHPDESGGFEGLVKAIYRDFLRSNINDSLNGACFPRNLHALNNARLEGPFLLQIVSVQDIGLSRIQQLERLTEFESGEYEDSKRIQRYAGDEGDEGEGHREEMSLDAPVGKGMCKLVVEDAQGLSAYAVEDQPVTGVRVGIALGAKMRVRDVQVLRGMLFLTPASVELLGGQIDAWNVDRLKRLRQEIASGLPKEDGNG